MVDILPRVAGFRQNLENIFQTILLDFVFFPKRSHYEWIMDLEAGRSSFGKGL
jgi:hypothetical protein